MRFSVTCLGFVLLLVALCGNAAGTIPFPPTRICREKGGPWHVVDDYVGGYALRFYFEGNEKARYVLPLKDAIPKTDYQRFPQQTTAGPLWAQYSVHYFVNLKGQTHFCIRTWWDRRILINLADLKQVADRPFATTLEQEERTIVLKALKAAVAKYVGTKEVETANPRDLSAVRTAAYMAGRMRIREAVEYLKPLETVARPGSSSGFWRHERFESGDIYCLECGKFPLRRVVQVSLRQLGERPQNYPTTTFEFSLESRDRFFSYQSKPDKKPPHELASKLAYDKPFTYQPKKYKESRHERASQLSEGMRSVAVLDAMGPPDVVDRSVGEWRWDVSAEKPYSFVVEWDLRSRTVTSVRRIAPVWLRKELVKEEDWHGW